MCPVNHSGAQAGACCAWARGQAGHLVLCAFPALFSGCSHQGFPLPIIMGTGDFHNKLTFQGTVQCPVSQANGGSRGTRGGSLQRSTHSSHLWGRCGSSVQAAVWPGDRQARGSPASCSCSSLSPRASPGGSSAVGAKKTPGAPCQDVPGHFECAKSCHPGTAWLPPSLSIWSPRHLAQSPDACTAAKPGPPPHSPQPPDQLCVAPPAPASGSCSEGGREGLGGPP